mgnify:CR=1 FL=1
MRKYLMLLAGLCLICGAAWGQTAKNMSLIGQLSFQDGLADVVGYKGGNTEYALVGHESGVGIVSLANPAKLFTAVNNPSMEPLAKEVGQRLQAVLERI